MSEPPIRDGLIRNTLGVPCRARRAWRLEQPEDFERHAHSLRQQRPIILGGASNVVLAAELDRPVFLIRNRGLSVAAAGADRLVTAQAGESWHDLVRWSLGQGLAGIENLALIPGSVGAAPVQNIGAYGVELADLLERLLVLDLTSGTLERLEPVDCGFGYRTSVFKREPGRFVIVSVTLRLWPAGARTVATGYPDVAEELERRGIARPSPVDLAEAVIRVRRRKLPDPRRVPNAGSFFKNPLVSADTFAALGRSEDGLRGYPEGQGVKLSAAQLIDRAGGKHVERAGIRVWRRQPLVLTNPGRRPATDVLEFAAELRARVQHAFGIRLEQEPDTVGFD